MLEPLLQELKNLHKKVIVVGHSLGGTLAPRVAMQYPSLIDGSVAIAGDLTSTHLKKEWYNEVASWKLTQFILPPTLKDANDEVLALPRNLDEMNQHWPKLLSPLWVIQGGEDTLVSPKNADFARSLQTRSDVYVNYFENAGHLIHITHAEKVNAILQAALRQIENNPHSLTFRM